MNLPDEIKIAYGEGDLYEEHIIEVPFSYLGEKAERVKLDTRAELGLRLFASGMRLSDAAKIAKTHPRKIRKLLATDQGKDTMKAIRLELDEEFKALYRDSIQVLREGLKSTDPAIKHKSADTYLKYAKDLNVNVVLSAEDLVRVIRDRNKDQGI
jgi:hypothetical protein